MFNVEKVSKFLENIEYYSQDMLKDFYSKSSDINKIGSFELYRKYLSTIFEDFRIEYRGDISGLEEFRYSNSVIDKEGISDVRHKMGSGVYTTPDLEQAQQYADRVSGKVYHVLCNESNELRYSSKLDFYRDVASFVGNTNRPPDGFDIDRFTRSMQDLDKSIHVKKISTQDETVHPVENTWILGSQKDILGFSRFLDSQNQNLIERNITFNDLDKTSSGQKRGDILLGKIVRGEEIPLKPEGESGVVIKRISDIINKNTQDTTSRNLIAPKYTPYDSVKMKDVFLKRPGYKKYTKSLRAEDGEEYKLNDIVKTSDFGSSGGSSLGTESTIKVESIYCFYFAIRQFLDRDISITDDTSYFLTSPSVLDFIKIPVQITQEILDEFGEWETSFIETVNGINRTEKYLVKDRKNNSVLDSNKKYSFHQINSRDDLITSLSDKYRSFNLGIPISKWTPSDIWAVDVERKDHIIGLIRACRSLSDLNRIVNNSFDRSELVGISIKKIKSGHNNFKIIINNESPKPLYTFSKVIVLDKPTGTLNTTIVVNRKSEVYGDGEEKVDFRTYESDIRNIVGEVLGKEAKFGKISLGQINRMLRNSEIKEVPITLELINFDESELKNKILDLNNEIIENPSLKDFIRRSNVRSDLKPETKRRLISKYQGLLLAKILLDTLLVDRESVDNLLQKIFYYALAIENQEYECPKYVRII